MPRKLHLWAFLTFCLLIILKSRATDNDSEEYEERVVFPDELKGLDPETTTTTISSYTSTTEPSGKLLRKNPTSIEINERHFVQVRKNCKPGYKVDKRGKCRRAFQAD